MRGEVHFSGSVVSAVAPHEDPSNIHLQNTSQQQNFLASRTTENGVVSVVPSGAPSPSIFPATAPSPAPPDNGSAGPPQAAGADFQFGRARSLQVSPSCADQSSSRKMTPSDSAEVRAAAMASNSNPDNTTTATNARNSNVSTATTSRNCDVSTATNTRNSNPASTDNTATPGVKNSGGNADNTTNPGVRNADTATTSANSNSDPGVSTSNSNCNSSVLSNHNSHFPPSSISTCSRFSPINTSLSNAESFPMSSNNTPTISQSFNSQSHMNSLNFNSSMGIPMSVSPSLNNPLGNPQSATHPPSLRNPCIPHPMNSSIYNPHLPSNQMMGMHRSMGMSQPMESSNPHSLGSPMGHPQSLGSPVTIPPSLGGAMNIPKSLGSPAGSSIGSPLESSSSLGSPMVNGEVPMGMPGQRGLGESFSFGPNASNNFVPQQQQFFLQQQQQWQQMQQQQQQNKMAQLEQNAVNLQAQREKNTFPWMPDKQELLMRGKGPPAYPQCTDSAVQQHLENYQKARMQQQLQQQQVATVQQPAPAPPKRKSRSRKKAQPAPQPPPPSAMFGVTTAGGVMMPHQTAPCNSMPLMPNKFGGMMCGSRPNGAPFPWQYNHERFGIPRMPFQQTGFMRGPGPGPFPGYRHPSQYPQYNPQMVHYHQMRQRELMQAQCGPPNSFNPSSFSHYKDQSPLSKMANNIQMIDAKNMGQNIKTELPTDGYVMKPQQINSMNIDRIQNESHLHVKKEPFQNDVNCNPNHPLTLNEQNKCSQIKTDGTSNIASASFVSSCNNVMFRSMGQSVAGPFNTASKNVYDASRSFNDATRPNIPLSYSSNVQNYPRNDGIPNFNKPDLSDNPTIQNQNKQSINNLCGMSSNNYCPVDNNSSPRNTDNSMHSTGLSPSKSCLNMDIKTENKTDVDDNSQYPTNSYCNDVSFKKENPLDYRDEIACAASIKKEKSPISSPNPYNTFNSTCPNIKQEHPNDTIKLEKEEPKMKSDSYNKLYGLRVDNCRPQEEKFSPGSKMFPNRIKSDNCDSGRPQTEMFSGQAKSDGCESRYERMQDEKNLLKERIKLNELLTPKCSCTVPSGEFEAFLPKLFL